MKPDNLDKLKKLADSLDNKSEHEASDIVDGLLKAAQVEPTDRKAVLEKELLHIRQVCLGEKEELETGIVELDATVAGIDNALLWRTEEKLEAELRHIKDLCVKERKALETGVVLQDESIASISKALGET